MLYNIFKNNRRDGTAGFSSHRHHSASWAYYNHPPIPAFCFNTSAAIMLIFGLSAPMLCLPILQLWLLCGALFSNAWSAMPTCSASMGSNCNTWSWHIFWLLAYCALNCPSRRLPFKSPMKRICFKCLLCSHICIFTYVDMYIYSHIRACLCRGPSGFW